MSVYKLQSFVIPAREASRESFLNNDSGQAGMTENSNGSTLYTDSNYGAGDGIRTRDPNLGKVVLYQLSYARMKLLNFPRELLITGKAFLQLISACVIQVVYFQFVRFSDSSESRIFRRC